MITKTVSQNLRYGFVFIIYLYFVLCLTKPPTKTRVAKLGAERLFFGTLGVCLYVEWRKKP